MLNTIIANQSPSGSPVVRTLKGANNRPLKVINPIIGTRRLPENQAKTQQPHSLRLEKTSSIDPSHRVGGASRSSASRLDFSVSNRANNRQRFTLSAEQSARLSQIRGEGSPLSSPLNPSINQYLETQNFQRREEITTLVGFDLFV